MQCSRDTIRDKTDDESVHQESWNINGDKSIINVYDFALRIAKVGNVPTLFTYRNCSLFDSSLLDVGNDILEGVLHCLLSRLERGEHVFQHLVAHGRVRV